MEDVRAIFRITGPNLTDNTVVVERTGIYAGRVSSNDLSLPDKQISRQHLRIVWQDGNFWVEDLNSTNGVSLNGKRIEAGIPMPLKVGDEITAGPFVLTLQRLVRPALGSTKPQIGIEEYPPTGTSSSSRASVPGLTESRQAIRIGGRVTERLGGSLTASQLKALEPHVKPRPDRYPNGIGSLPEDRSNWLKYLPAIYADKSLDPTEFMGRYLLIFETIFNPITWMVDNFDLYLDPQTAPDIWLQWMGSWFDIGLLNLIPVERQRTIMEQMDWLYLRRGTKAGLERLLSLYFGVTPTIIEETSEAPHVLIRLPLGQSGIDNAEDIARAIIENQLPAFATFTLEIG